MDVGGGGIISKPATLGKAVCLFPGGVSNDD